MRNKAIFDTLIGAYKCAFLYMSETKTNLKEEIKNLFEAGAHFAYTKSRRHPSNKPFIFGNKNKIEIFDLEKTQEKLEEAREFVKEQAVKGVSLLIVGGKKEAQKPVVDMATSLGVPYVAGRWIGGTLTNFTEIRKRVKRLNDLLDQKEKGLLAKYTKKERLLIDREIEKLEKLYRGIADLDKLPGLIIMVDPKFEDNALQEADQLNIPVVAIAGSDCDLSSVTKAIPANDSSRKSISYILGELREAFQEGSKLKAKKS